MRAFDDLVTQGKVRYVGCSNNSAWQVMKALAVSDRLGMTRYVCQQVNYNLVARDVEHEIIPLGLDQSVGLMAWSPLHAGLLSRQVPARRAAAVGQPPQRARRSRHGRLRTPLPDRRQADEIAQRARA